MELKLDRKEIEEVLLAYLGNTMPEAKFNAVRVHPNYGTFEGMTFTHTDLPAETENE